jgi:protein TonB
LLHALLAVYWYWPARVQNEEQQLTNVRIVQIARRTPAPAQTRAPKPLPSVAAVPSKTHARVTTPHLTAPGGKNAPGHPPRMVAAAATPRPTAVPSASAGCAHPNAPPAVSSTPDVPGIAAEARAARVSGVAAIDVSLDPSGAVTGAKVARSSGNDGLDASAVTMARGATYTPQYAACKGVAGTYTFTVRFVAW